MSYGSERRTYSSGGGSDIGSRRSFSQKPVEVGKEYDVQIMETSRRGDGVARIQGFVIFVKNGRAGQKVKAKITSVGERFATAEIV
jgi:predicted RNA-binding protein with TRAM domain